MCSCPASKDRGIIVEVLVVEENFGHEARVFCDSLELLIEEVFENITPFESPHERRHLLDPVVEPVRVGI